MLGLTVVAVVLLVPSIVGQLPSWLDLFLPVEHVRLGLDLRGGTHLVLTVQVDKAIQGIPRAHRRGAEEGAGGQRASRRRS